MIKYGIDSEKGIDRLTGATFIKALDVLQKYLSPEGFEIVVKFAKGATGLNRSWILGTLISLYTGKVKNITKSELRSYANSDLFKLFETGDLKELKRGVVVPGNYVEVSNEEKVKDLLREKTIEFVRYCKDLYFKNTDKTETSELKSILTELIDEELKNY